MSTMLPGDIWYIIAQFVVYDQRRNLLCCCKYIARAIYNAPIYDDHLIYRNGVDKSLLKTCHNDGINPDPQYEYIIVDGGEGHKLSQLDKNRRYMFSRCEILLDDYLPNYRITMNKCLVRGYLVPLNHVYRHTKYIVTWTLRTLHINGGRFHTLPDLPAIKTLTIRYCKIYHVGRLDSVEYLNISHNNISVLPDMPYCTRLIARYNKLTILPTISERAQIIIVDNNRITSVGKLSHCLHRFVASYNRLRELHDIRCRYMNISRNPLVTLATQSEVIDMNMSATLCHLLPDMPKVLKLNISYCKMLTVVPKYPVLWQLIIFGCNVMLPMFPYIDRIIYDKVRLVDTPVGGYNY